MITYKLNKNFLLLLVVIFFYVLGTVTFIFRANMQLDDYSVQRSEIIGQRVDAIISEILFVYYKDLAQYKDNCDQFIEESRRALLTLPYARSISIGDSDYLYCSSVTRKKRISIRHVPLDDKPKSLLYLPQSPIDGISDVIVLKLHVDDERNIFFGIHPYIFKNLLGSGISYVTPSFNINNYIISEYQPTYYATSYSSKFESNYIKVAYVNDFNNYQNFLLINYSTKYILFLTILFITWVILYRFINSFDFLRVYLWRALRNNEIVPYYQPIIDGRGNVKGVEVLARWITQKGKFISPAEFIPTAESSGQISTIFSSLTDQVIADLKDQQYILRKGFHISLNVSAPQLLDKQLINDCKKLKDAFASEHINLVLELTERVEIPFDANYDKVIRQLKAMGFLFALDDFGMGHSSLKYIKSLKIDLLKVDKSFIDMIQSDGSEDHIVANVLDLARRLRIPVIAEGIEMEHQHEYLKKQNVAYFQGYLFAKPLPFNAFVDDCLLSGNNECCCVQDKGDNTINFKPIQS